MNSLKLSSESAQTVARPGCVGMRAQNIARTEQGSVTALYFAKNAHSDEHAAPFDQWLIVTRGNGWVGVDNEKTRVNAGDAIALPKDMFHQFWTENETMDALAFALERGRGVELVRVPHRVALAGNAAQRFMQIAQEAIHTRGRFCVALSGGTTPRDLYELLAKPEYSQQIDWARVHFFWGDERAVPPEHPDSNFRMANEALISKIPIPQENVHRILGENKPHDAARDYEQTLREFFENPLPSPSPVSRGREGVGVGVRMPHFDLILLGLGADGHTASLFPHTSALRETARWVIAYFVDEAKKNRITLTAPVINAAENIFFLVAGAEKAQAVRAVLRGDDRPDDFPAQLIQPTRGRVAWLLDREAARGLEIPSQS